MQMRSSALLLPHLVVLVLGFQLACRQPPEPPRGVDENPPVEDIVEETVAPAPESTRVLVETDRVAVTEVRLAPGARLTLHRGGDRVLYGHTGGSLRLSPTSQTGETTSASFRAGEVVRLPSGSLTVENAGAPEARFLVVTRSSEPPPLLAGAGEGLAGLAGARELFRDRGVAVHTLTLDTGGSLSVPDAPLEVIRVLGPGELRVEPAAAEWISSGTGPVHLVAGPYRVSNPGAQPVRLAVFRFRP